MLIRFQGPRTSRPHLSESAGVPPAFAFSVVEADDDVRVSREERPRS